MCVCQSARESINEVDVSFNKFICVMLAISAISFGIVGIFGSGSMLGTNGVLHSEDCMHHITLDIIMLNHVK